MVKKIKKRKIILPRWLAVLFSLVSILFSIIFILLCAYMLIFVDNTMAKIFGGLMGIMVVFRASGLKMFKAKIFGNKIELK